MEKRYQVFISSTFIDLIDERRAVMQALLELNCIPAGMELFPASSDEQWTVIQRVIDDCDYYLIIVGGRYGSMDSQGISYTEKEYDYALSQGKPVLGFVHRNPGDIPAKLTDRDPAVAAKLEAFRAKVQQRLCRFWTNADELGGAVSRSYVTLLKTHPAEGWVKSRYAKTTEDLEKVNWMHEQIRILEEEIARLRESGAASATHLAQGEDEVTLNYSWKEQDAKHEGSVTVTWNQVFARVARSCMDLAPEDGIEFGLNGWLKELTGRSEPLALRNLEAIKIQFYSLGLIRMEVLLKKYGWGNEPPQPTLCWTLTEAGRTALGNLLAAKRPAVAYESAATRKP